MELSRSPETTPRDKLLDPATAAGQTGWSAIVERPAFRVPG